MRKVCIRGIIIDVVNFQDSHQIVKILTSELGLISAFARNSRNSRKRFPAGLNLLSISEFIIQETNKNIAYDLLETSNHSYFSFLQNDISKIISANLAVECLRTTLPELDASYGWCFDFLIKYFHSLENNKNVRDIFIITNYFMMNVLAKNGFIDPNNILEQIFETFQEKIDDDIVKEVSLWFQKMSIENVPKRTISDSSLLFSTLFLIKFFEMHLNVKLNAKEEFIYNLKKTIKL